MTKNGPSYYAILLKIACISLFFFSGVELTFNQVNKSNSDASNVTAKPLINQDKNSDDWWKSIIKKQGINYESYTIHYQFVIFGKKTINNDIESFNNVIAIEKGIMIDGYIIFKSKTASYDSKSNMLKIYDCTMNFFDWNSKNNEPSKSYAHISFWYDFSKNISFMADTLSN